MYSFRVYPTAGRVVVRLDKPSDRCGGVAACCGRSRFPRLTPRRCRSFGSPLVDELTAFSLAFDTALDAAGVSPDELTVEVSSAGAERCACAVSCPCHFPHRAR